MTGEIERGMWLEERKYGEREGWEEELKVGKEEDE